MLNGIKGNFETTFNVGNFVNYLTTDNYNEIKDYSKSVVQTGVTLYGSYNVGKGIYKATHPTEVIMSQVNIANINDKRLGQISNNYVLSKISPIKNDLSIISTSRLVTNLWSPKDLINIHNLDDIINDPRILSNTNPSELYNYLKNNNYDPKPLKNGNLKNISYQDGGGYKVNWGGDRIIQYHPAGGIHHQGQQYYKISSGTTGTIRYDIFGNQVK